MHYNVIGELIISPFFISFLFCGLFLSYYGLNLCYLWCVYLVYILLIWKCVSISLISTLFQSVCKYCLFSAECVNVIIVSIHWFCRYARLEGNAFVSTVRLKLTLGYIMYVMCFNYFICIVCFVLCYLIHFLYFNRRGKMDAGSHNPQKTSRHSNHRNGSQNNNICQSCTIFYIFHKNKTGNAWSHIRLSPKLHI